MVTVREGSWFGRAGQGVFGMQSDALGVFERWHGPWIGSAARTWRAAALRMGGGFRMSRDRAERWEVSSCPRGASARTTGRGNRVKQDLAA